MCRVREEENILVRRIFATLAIVASAVVLIACGNEEELTTETSTEQESTTESAVSEAAKNKITVKADGEEKSVESSVATVGELLTEIGISTGENDIVEPAVTETLTEGMTVTVKRVTSKNVTETQDIPFSTQKKYSDSMQKGATKTEKQGVNGKKEIVYSVTYTDGVESDRKLISENIIQQPVDAVIVYGTAAAEKTTAEKPASAPATTKPAEEPTTASAPARPTPDLSGYDKSQIASIEAVDDCDGSGHGYFMITFIDGHVEYQDY